MGDGNQKTELLNLLVKSPVLDDDPEDCLLHDLRALQWYARLRWVTKLSDQELRDIFAYHEACFARKKRKNE
jgi:hypothetical protein